MNEINNIQEVWNNGAISTASLLGNEVGRFKQKTGATRVVGTKWKYRGKDYGIPYYIRVLKDKTGVVHFENDDLRTGRLVVRNGDGTERVIISFPASMQILARKTVT